MKIQGVLYFLGEIVIVQFNWSENFCLYLGIHNVAQISSQHPPYTLEVAGFASPSLNKRR